MEAGVHCIIWQIRLRQTHLLQNSHFFLDQRPAWIGKYARLHVSWRPGTNLHGDQTSYTPQVIVSRSFSNQVVNVHVVGLSDTMHSVLCLNENLQGEKASRFSITPRCRARIAPKAVKHFTDEPLDGREMSVNAQRCRHRVELVYAAVINVTSYPRIPEKLGKDHQVSWVQGQTHVGCRDWQHGHTAVSRELELLAQLLPFGWRSRPVNPDVADILLGNERNCQPTWNDWLILHPTTRGGDWDGF